MIKAQKEQIVTQKACPLFDKIRKWHIQIYGVSSKVLCVSNYETMILNNEYFFSAQQLITFVCNAFDFSSIHLLQIAIKI